MSNKTGAKAIAVAEKQRKMALVNDLKSQSFTKPEIAEKTGIPIGTVSNYLNTLRKQERKLAETLDPKLLAAKKADIVTGLEYDLKVASEQLAISKKGIEVALTNSRRVPITDKKGQPIFEIQVNEMAVVRFIQTCADIRMKIANLYGLTNPEMTVTGEIKHVFDVKSNMPPPSAGVVDVTPDKSELEAKN